ncbi:MAG TPA: hypothetical protein DFR83_23400, partial [Deltaproteobacteria bacterium]|nr:hypothetical protein [Deltaproteobacteria bacterium]
EAVLRASVGTHLEQCACAFREVGVSIDLAVREGDPVKNILAEAQGTGAQLIVMVGAGGAGGADGCDLLVDAVVRGAQVPVMVVSTEDDAPVIAPPTPVVVPLQDE